MEFTWCTAVASALALFLSFYFLFKHAKSRDSKIELKSPPEAAGGWPFIGHLNLLSGPDKPHLKLSNLAEKYGPIFGIRLGVHRCIIVSTWEIAKEIFSQNDLIFSDRPQTAAFRLMGYDLAMFGFNNYCSYWREVRKVCLLKLLSNHKVSMHAGVWESEIRSLMKSIYVSFQNNNQCHVELEMKKCLQDMTLNSMVRIIAGSTVKKLDSCDSEKWRREIREFFKMMGVLTFSDVVPFLKWLDYFKGTKKAFKQTAKVMDTLLQSWLEQHKKLNKANSDEQDFMDEMIGIGDSISTEFPKYDADTITKATCEAMLIGGTDTTSVTLTWILCLLLNNRRAIMRAQEELDNHVGKSRKLEKSDIENLVYIKAIIKETLRMQPPTLVTPPRKSSQNSTVQGYYIPAGTQLIINLWKLHRDPSVWSDPLEFKPERFLTENRDLDIRGQHFQYLPFGAGRRICPGITFAIHFMELALATLLHGFDIESPSGEAVDMEVNFGSINDKATPLQVLLKPRLSPNLYA